MSANSKPHDEHPFGMLMCVGSTFVVLLFAVASLGHAESDADRSESQAPDVASEAPADAKESGRHASELSLGIARAGGNTEIGLGIEYEYGLSERWGIGAVLGHTPKADDYDGTSVALAMVHLHPTPALSLSAGTGIERVHGANGHDQQMLFLGIARTFQAGRISITPSLSLENVNGETTKIFDISFAMNFQKTPTLSISLANETP